MLQQLNSLFVFFHAHSLGRVLWRSDRFLTCRYFSGEKKRQIPKVSRCLQFILRQISDTKFSSQRLDTIDCFKKNLIKMGRCLPKTSGLQKKVCDLCQCLLFLSVN